MEASRVFQSHKKFYHSFQIKNLRCWDVSFNNSNRQIGLPFTIPILSVLGREPHPTGLDTLCRWNGPNHSRLKDQYAEACQNCLWSQTMETLSIVVYTLLKKGFGFWWDEMYFLHASNKDRQFVSETKVFWRLHSHNHYFFGNFVKQKSMHAKLALLMHFQFTQLGKRWTT